MCKGQAGKGKERKKSRVVIFIIGKLKIRDKKHFQAKEKHFIIAKLCNSQTVMNFCASNNIMQSVFPVDSLSTTSVNLQHKNSQKAWHLSSFHQTYRQENWNTSEQREMINHAQGLASTGKQQWKHSVLLGQLVEVFLSCPWHCAQQVSDGSSCGVWGSGAVGMLFAYPMLVPSLYLGRR